MEGPSNGGLLYHEVQESKLCAVHCVNTLLQGPFFSEVDLAALASDLDRTERQMMADGGSGDFSLEGSHNVSLGGDFSIQVLEKALGVWDMQVIPLNSPAVEASKYDPELENAFICHLHDHWFCVRKVNGEWYNFNSLYAAPEHLSKFYLSAFLDTLKSSGWSIFLVRGNFPKECPISSADDSNAFGQWLTPEDAKRITKSFNDPQIPLQRENPARLSYPSQLINEADVFSSQEELDLNAAIAASLMDSSAFASGTDPMGSHTIDSQSGITESSGMMEDMNAAIAASFTSVPADTTAVGVVEDKDNPVGSVVVGSQSGVKESCSKSVEVPTIVTGSSLMDMSTSGIIQDKGNSASTAAVGSQSGNLMELQTDCTETDEPEDVKFSDPAACNSNE